MGHAPGISGMPLILAISVLLDSYRRQILQTSSIEANLTRYSNVTSSMTPMTKTSSCEDQFSGSAKRGIAKRAMSVFIVSKTVEIKEM